MATQGNMVGLNACNGSDAEQTEARMDNPNAKIELSPSAKTSCHRMIDRQCFDRGSAGVIYARQLHYMPQPE